MQLPFTIEQFLGVFESYNTTVFPYQIFSNLLALIVIFLAFKKTLLSDKIIGYSLSFLWIWIGIVYHYTFFARINPAAKFFAVLFFLQGILFWYFVGVDKKLSFDVKKDVKGITGALFILYALIIYPLLGIVFGHTYPRNPTFGLPCPTTIFTFGILLWSVKKVPWYLFIIPLLWSMLGFSAAFKLGVWEDTGLLVAGITGSAMLLITNKKSIKLQTS